MEVTTANEIIYRRAEAVAVMLLTRHFGVSLATSPADAFDLLVTMSPEKGGGRVFGVEVKGRLNLQRTGRIVAPNQLMLSSSLRRALERQLQRVSDLPFPLLYLAIEMEHDQCFYGWMREPLIRGRHALLVSKEDKFLAKRWEKSTHATIIAAVNAWYDQR